ncbi:polysaccharide biosynthesis tyrosine autokinase [Parabacteroides sp. ZJ-118]|uniref:GumC family protein n=1 Tax=Parabacteroides sp. ZJ-118 TaxID=2709398 RepID=UPI0013ECF86C|nr:polysaccharide biosynthesis tyrosine autokinase [Parabacteroides sp. ZJ-118]
MTARKNTLKNPAISQVQISDILFITLKKWYWILASLTICVGGAYLYLLRSQPTYTRTAAIVIKDDSKGKSASAELDAFSDMGLIQTNTNINDEINKLQSPDIMEEVVKRLHLDMGYWTDGRFHREIVYGPSLPLSVSFPSLLESESASVTIDISKSGTLTLSDLTHNGEEVTFSPKAISGDTLSSPLGPVAIHKTAYFQPGTDYRIYAAKIPLKSAIAMFSGKLVVALKSDKGSTINLTATDQSTLRAEDLLNTVISVYNEKWIENRNQISISTSEFITERLGRIEQELGSVDQDISSYQSEHLIPNVQQAASMYMSENQTASAQILDLSNQLQMTRYMRSYLVNESNKKQLLPANSGIGNMSIESQIAEYNTKMAQRNQYAANSSDTHPLVIDLDAVLAGMRNAIISTIDNRITALNTQIKNLQQSKNKITVQLSANPSQAKYLLSVERQQKVKESLYLFLLQKREENELSQAFTAYNTQVITKPNGSNVPTAPAKSKILLGAFVIGLFLPFGITYLIESNNTKVRGRKDLDVLSAPFLGEIPFAKNRKGETSDTKIVVKHGKRDVINEAFRVLRTNLSFLSAQDNGCGVIMLSSFNPGSGKTFLALNIGTSLAIKGKKVLVIDGDMRRCSASAYVGSPRKGVSDYLIGTIEEIGSLIVADTLTPGLSILPVGPIPPNPTELLESDRFSSLIAELRKHYDTILIDCPPLEMIADAQIIETVADRMIFVIRTGVFDRSMLADLEKIYESKKYKNMAVVLNATPMKGFHYGYKYGYGYGYGNYNHYTSDKS